MGGGVQASLAAPKLVPASTLPVGTLPLKVWAHGGGDLGPEGEERRAPQRRTPEEARDRWGHGVLKQPSEPKEEATVCLFNAVVKTTLQQLRTWVAAMALERLLPLSSPVVKE